MPLAQWPEILLKEKETIGLAGFASNLIKFLGEAFAILFLLLFANRLYRKRAADAFKISR